MAELPGRATLLMVKPVRIWFVLLLVILLPMRGAVAAAMLCPGAGVQAEQRVHDHTLDHAAMDHSMAHDHAAGHAGGGNDHAMTDKCNMCSAYCSLTPLVGSLPAVMMPLDFTAVRFPDLASPPPSFISDAQERPPRTI